MLIKFLGTGAAEGIPATFCRCAVCENARRTKGKEIRMRTGVAIDDALLIDFSPDSLTQSVRFDIDYTGLQALLVTHTHSDHFAVDDLIQRSPYNSMNRTAPILGVYGNAVMEEKLKAALSFDENAAQSMEIAAVRGGQKFRIGEYQVLALKTIHMETEDSLLYLISKEGKHYLHALDSAELTEETYELLFKEGICLDAVSLDCTFGLLEEEFYGHMNFRQNLRVKERLERLGLADAHTKFYLTHISHYAGCTQEDLEAEAGRHGFAVAYDGLCVQIV